MSERHYDHHKVRRVIEGDNSRTLDEKGTPLRLKIKNGTLRIKPSPSTDIVDLLKAHGAKDYSKDLITVGNVRLKIEWIGSRVFRPITYASVSTVYGGKRNLFQ